MTDVTNFCLRFESNCLFADRIHFDGSGTVSKQQWKIAMEKWMGVAFSALAFRAAAARRLPEDPEHRSRGFGGRRAVAVLERLCSSPKPKSFEPRVLPVQLPLQWQQSPLNSFNLRTFEVMGKHEEDEERTTII